MIDDPIRSQSARTAAFYDRWNAAFVDAFGTTFQAGLLGPTVVDAVDADASAALLAGRAGVVDGERLLDAGCGVGGPAVAIASAHPRCRIDGVTVSTAQAATARALVARHRLDRRVAVCVADFHWLPYRDDTFDGALFLESVGYSADRDRLFAEAVRVVRPGGRIYVKDVFVRPESLTDRSREDLDEFDRLWSLAESPTLDGVTASLVAAGCEVVSSGEIPNVGTAHMVAAMVEPDPETFIRYTEIGEVFGRPSLNLPLFFGEVLVTVT